jgi:hypothetical protein
VAKIQSQKLAEDDIVGKPQWGKAMPFPAIIGPPVPKGLRPLREAGKTNNALVPTQIVSEKEAALYNRDIPKGERFKFPSILDEDLLKRSVWKIPLFSRKYPKRNFYLGKYTSGWPALGETRSHEVLRTREFAHYADLVRLFEDELLATLVDVWKKPHLYDSRSRAAIRKEIFSWNPDSGYLRSEGSVSSYKVNPSLYYWVCLFLRKAQPTCGRAWSFSRFHRKTKNSAWLKS